MKTRTVQETRHLLFVLTVILVLEMVRPFPAPGYQVLVHVGHDFTARELATAEDWEEVAERADGVWTFDAWIRTLKTPAEQDTVLGHLKSREFCVAEFHWSPYFVGENRASPNPVIDSCERTKFHEIWCMTYDESRYGSTLSPEQIARYRELYPEYKVITNFRVFDADRFPNELAALDGMSYEFNVIGYGQTSQHHPDQTKLENVVEAVRWCLDHNKLIVLLMPPGDDRPAEEDRFIEAMKQLIRDLDEALEDQYFRSDSLVLVPATYDCRQRGVHNTPERKDGCYANTGMGATLAAIDYRDDFAFRNHAGPPISGSNQSTEHGGNDMFADPWGPIDLTNWRAVPHISGRLATEDDVRLGSAVFHTEGPERDVYHMDLPVCAIYTEEPTGKKRPVAVIQVEEANGRIIVGARYLQGGNMVCTLPELTIVGGPTDLFEQERIQK